MIKRFVRIGLRPEQYKNFLLGSFISKYMYSKSIHSNIPKVIFLLKLHLEKRFLYS